MIEYPFIMLIMNCVKYRAKALIQKNTWLKNIPKYIKYYHVIGNNSLEQNYLFDDENNILWVKTLDDYNSLPKKVISAYSAIYDTFKFKYLFKTDDDQILVNDKFLSTISQILDSKNPHYGGYIVDVKQPYMSEYYKIHPELPKKLPILQTKYCSGRFYFLSFSAISHLLTKREEIEREYLEDYAIGINLDPCYKTNIMHILTNNFFTDIDCKGRPLSSNKIS